MTEPLEIDVQLARRLALRQAGLLPSKTSGLPRSARGKGVRARRAAHAVIDRFGYLQLDTVSVAGARSHSIVLHSRLMDLETQLGEELLRPGEPIFEYWGHEASWLPMRLYPYLEFRRVKFRTHPWWGDVVSPNRKLANEIMQKVRDKGPIRSSDLEGKDHGPWWGHRISKQVITGLWSSGELAIRERVGFQRVYDLPERVIPEEYRADPKPEADSKKELFLQALEGHGWATQGTIAQTWRFRNIQAEMKRLLEELAEEGRILASTLITADGRRIKGWLRAEHRELLPKLARLRPREDEGVLLSPFDPVLWDRRRVQILFGFEQVLEIFKKEHERVHGYYVLPVLAGERILGRVDLKAHRGECRLEIRKASFESTGTDRPNEPTELEAVRSALQRYQNATGLSSLTGWPALQPAPPPPSGRRSPRNQPNQEPTRNQKTRKRVGDPDRRR